MKINLTISALVLMFSMHTYAQVLENDQVKITNTTIETTKLNYKIFDLEYLDNSTVLTQSRFFNPMGYEVRGNSLWLALYNIDDATHKEVLLEAKKETAYHRLVKTNKSAVVLRTEYDKDTQKNLLYFDQIQTNSLALTASKSPVISFNEEDKQKGDVGGEIRFCESPNKNLFALNYRKVEDVIDNLGYAFNASLNRVETDEIQIAVFNSDLSLKWQQSYSVNHASENFDVQETIIDDAGNAYVIGRKFISKNRKAIEKDQINVLYTLYVFNDNGSSVKEYDINSQGLVLDQMKLTLTPSGDVVVVGGYRDIAISQKMLSTNHTSSQDLVIEARQMRLQGRLIFKLNTKTGEKSIEKTIPLNLTTEQSSNLEMVEGNTLRYSMTRSISTDKEGNVFVVTESVPLAPANTRKYKEKTAALIIEKIDASFSSSEKLVFKTAMNSSGFGVFDTDNEFNIVYSISPRIYQNNPDLEDEGIFQFTLVTIEKPSLSATSKTLMEIESGKKFIDNYNYTKGKSTEQKALYFKAYISDKNGQKMIMTDNPSSNWCNLTSVEVK